jgi:RNA polymerase sigma-70 factor (ECF subfamily)
VPPRTFGALVDAYQVEMYRYLWHLAGDPATADDLFQETFLRALPAFDRLRTASNHRAWIYRIATNEALMRLRKARRKREVFLEDTPGGDQFGEEIRDFARSALDDVQDAEIREALSRTLAELPEEYRVVFTMRDIDGLSNAEVAEVLEISVPAVKSRLHRSRLFLRDRLSKVFQDRKDAPREEEKAG